MSRYRPPAPPKSPYITLAGAKTLQKELTHLWKVERPIVTNTVHEAAKNGDRSENGDYIYGKQRLREIDRRVRYLSKRLDEVTIIDQLPNNKSNIYFGAQVTLKTQTSQILTIRIVGVDEIDVKNGSISIDSPLAKLLLGKSLGDEVQLKSSGPEDITAETSCYLIMEITYKNLN